ncbi:unnamed protein product [Rhodiola kirilowii]
MEVESTSKDTNTLLRNTNTRSFSSNRRKWICLIVVAIVLAIAIIFLTLALTVFKPKDPKIAPNSVSLDHFALALDLPRLRVVLNVTIRVDLSVHNPNFVGMKYRNTTALVYYRDELVGEVPIPAGKIGAHDTQRMDVMLLVLADRLISNSNAYTDVLAGSIEFTTVTKISGKVKILNMFSIRVTATSTCAVVIDVRSGALSSSTCETKT